MVAAQAHQKGSKISATNPSSMKTIQNIFFCIEAIVMDEIGPLHVDPLTSKVRSPPGNRFSNFLLYPILNLAFDYDKDSRTGVGFAHQYEVRTNQGKPAGKRTISHPEIGSTGHGWPDRVLKPGESMDISGDHISGLYDLTRPDQCTIQLLRAINNDPKNGFVKSNIITVTVTK